MKASYDALEHIRSKSLETKTPPEGGALALPHFHRRVACLSRRTFGRRSTAPSMQGTQCANHTGQGGSLLSAHMPNPLALCAVRVNHGGGLEQIDQRSPCVCVLQPLLSAHRTRREEREGFGIAPRAPLRRRKGLCCCGHDAPPC